MVITTRILLGDLIFMPLFWVVLLNIPVDKFEVVGVFDASDSESNSRAPRTWGGI